MTPAQEKEIDYNITYASLNPAHNTPMGVVGPLLELQRAEIVKLREVVTSQRAVIQRFIEVAREEEANP